MLLIIPTTNSESFVGSFLTSMQHQGAGWPGVWGQRWEWDFSTGRKLVQGWWAVGEGRQLRDGASSSWLEDSRAGAQTHSPAPLPGKGVLFGEHEVQEGVHEAEGSGTPAQPATPGLPPGCGALSLPACLRSLHTKQLLKSSRAPSL